MQSRTVGVLACVLVIFVLASLLLGDEEAASDRAQRGAAARAAAREAIEKLARLRPFVATEFDRSNSAEDLLTGCVTYSRPEGEAHVAYVFLRWGDLDRLIPRCSPDHYSNWDGYVSVGAGELRVEAEYAFDDGTGKPGSPDLSESTGKRGRATGPREGSGRDRLDLWQGGKRVEWRSAVVGATDGLLIRAALPSATGTVVIQAGQFQIVLGVSSVPAEKAAAIAEEQEKMERRIAAWARRRAARAAAE